VKTEGLLDLDLKTVRADRLLVLLTALIAAVVYLSTLASTVSFWDSGEYITCSWVAGVPHPPGVPLFVLSGRVSTLLFSFLPSIAQRVNLLCALSGVMSIALVSRLVQRWAHRMGFSPSAYRPMSMLAGLLAAFSYSVWRNNNGTETYAVALLLSMIILWVFDLWLVRRSHDQPAGRLLLLLGYLMTLSIANHLSALIVVAPITLVYVHYAVRKKTRSWMKPAFVLTFLGLMVLAFSIHLYMPIRAVQRPEINETNPDQWESFRQALAREQYGQVSIFSRKGPFGDQLALYMEYLSWQTGRPSAWNSLLGQGASRIGTVIWVLLMAGVVYGLITLGARRPDLLLLIGFTFLMASFAFVVYLNFKTGPEGTSAGEVRERDYFFGASFVFFAMLSSIGLVSALRELIKKGRRKYIWALMLIPAISIAVNYHRCDRSGDFIAHDYGVNLLESCSEGAVLITNGDNDTFPLWFAQGVLGVRRDVIVSNLSLMNTPWYTEQLIARDSLLLSYETYDLVDSLRAIFIWGPDFFHVGAEAFPEWSNADNLVLRSTFDQKWPWAVVSDEFAAVVPNMGLGSQGAVPMQDLLLFDMVSNQSVHGRDIYFAGTVAIDNRVYFQDYLEMEGIAFRLVDHPVIEAVNSERGWNLLDGYRYTGLDDPAVFKGDQARQLARNYVSACHRLAYHHIAMGEPEQVVRALQMAEQLMITMPDEWHQILPSQSLIEARLIDGLHGPEAAIDTIFLRADQISAWATRTGNTRMAGAAMGLIQITEEFQQEQAFREVIADLDNGSAASTWLRIEVDLSFGNFISAWDVYAELERDHPEDPLLPFIHDFLETSASGMSIHSRLNLTRSAVFTVFEFYDQEVQDRFVWTERIEPEPVLMAVTSHLAEGRIVPACAAGLLLAERIADPYERSMVVNYIDWILSDTDGAVELAVWFLLEGNRTTWESVAWQTTRVGNYPLSWLALSLSGSTSTETLESLLRSPDAYMNGMPEPGNGRGVYSWMNTLIGD